LGEETYQRSLVSHKQNVDTTAKNGVPVAVNRIQSGWLKRACLAKSNRFKIETTVRKQGETLRDAMCTHRDALFACLKSLVV
jgi:hypothetical protein